MWLLAKQIIVAKSCHGGGIVSLCHFHTLEHVFIITNVVKECGFPEADLSNRRVLTLLCLRKCWSFAHEENYDIKGSILAPHVGKSHLQYARHTLYLEVANQWRCFQDSEAVVLQTLVCLQTNYKSAKARHDISYTLQMPDGMVFNICKLRFHLNFSNTNKIINMLEV